MLPKKACSELIKFGEHLVSCLLKALGGKKPMTNILPSRMRNHKWVIESCYGATPDNGGVFYTSRKMNSRVQILTFDKVTTASPFEHIGSRPITHARTYKRTRANKETDIGKDRSAPNSYGHVPNSMVNWRILAVTKLSVKWAAV